MRRRKETIEEKTHKLEMRLRVQHQPGARRIPSPKRQLPKIIKPCLKLQHQTAASAEHHKASLEAVGEMDLGVYQCKKCNAWHVGHSGF